jgi:hypothetical protein
MSDHTAPDSQAIAGVDEDSDSQRKPYRDYSLEDKFIALAAVDLNGGNVYRTPALLRFPTPPFMAGLKTVRQAPSFYRSSKEKSGDLAIKMESVIHSSVEAMPSKIPKATLSQTAITTGILVDKVRILRGEGLEPDPAAELCRLLNINRAQLPDRLELKPGDVIPLSFSSPSDTLSKPNQTPKASTSLKTTPRAWTRTQQKRMRTPL